MHVLLSSLILICYNIILYACVTSALTPLTDSNINAAADLWISDEAQALETYGNIKNWDVSQVTSLSETFKGASHFNADLSKWDVSKVTKFDAMFRNTKSFNQNISSWKLLSAVFVRDMFRNAYEFNQDLSNWNLNNLNTNNLGGCCGFRSGSWANMKWTKAIPNFGTLIGGSTYYCGDIAYNGCQY